jgi:hypothetical protein
MMSTRNPNSLAPIAHELDPTSRYAVEPFYENQLARPRHMQDRTRRSHEELRAEEGLWRQVAPEFYEQLDSADSTTSNEYQWAVAGQADGRREPGRSNPRPSWQHVPAEVLSSFASASSGDQESFASPDTPPQRGLGPTWGIGTERPTNIVVAVQPDPAAPWRQRRNQAEVEGRP